MKKFNENFTRADAEAMGLMVGSKIQYIKPMENNQNRKIIKNGPEPTPGYYIDPESVVCGVNKYTGLSYLRYTEIRIKPLERGDSG